nr:serine/threonine/dual specificity protein kinase, catalytic domain-containing protein [Tanacetum cinerariifolium]
CEQMLPGPTTVTVEVRIAPLQTMYPSVAWVALLTETEINAGIQQHLQKAYNTNKAAFKAQHWVIDPMTGTYNVEKIRWEHRENITASEWDKYGSSLDYPHTGTGVESRVIHRDVKSTNVLLDDKLTAKFFNFEVSRIGPTNQLGNTNGYTGLIRGTFGYVDAEPALYLTLDEQQHSLAGWAKQCIKEDVARSHGGDGGGKGKRKPNLCGSAAGRLNTRDKTRNLSLKEITDIKGPVPIQFKLRDKKTIMPLGDHAAHWSSYIREVIRGVPLYYPSWLKVPKERKAALITDIRAAHGIPRLDRDQRGHPTALAKGEYPSLIDTFFVAQTINGEFLRDEDRRIYKEMRRLEAMGTYTNDEINRLARGGKQRGNITGVGSVLPTRATASPSTPVHDSMLNSLHKKVDFMMSIFKSDSKYSDMFLQFESGGASGSGGCEDEEEGADHQDDEDEDGNGDT